MSRWKFGFGSWVSALACAALLHGCTTFTDTSLVAEREGSGGTVNACGGPDGLLYQGAPADLGDRCGVCGDGFLVCAGLSALGCVGDTPENACGGCGELPNAPYTPCGPCGDGQWECSGEDGLTCAYASSVNACGGCERLDGAPGFECAIDPPSTWACTSTTNVACITGLLNECGGRDELIFDERRARPGEPCEGGCGDGVLVCDGEEGLSCEGAVEANACGGCAVPPGEKGDPCGPCGGTWDCSDSGEFVCSYPEGAGAPNACGGCEPLASEPGEACSSDGVAVCIGPDAVTCVARGPDTNACGGLGAIPEGEAPGASCGGCGQGFFACEGTSGTTCVDTFAGNGCGGCVRLEAEPGTRCGLCGSGTWTCEGEDALACVGEASADEAGVTNACGGCGDLYGDVGAECALCRNYACLGTLSLQCVFDTNGSCGGEVTCEDLGCEEQFRECELDANPRSAVCASRVSWRKTAAAVRPTLSAPTPPRARIR